MSNFWGPLHRPVEPFSARPTSIRAQREDFECGCAPRISGDEHLGTAKLEGAFRFIMCLKIHPLLPPHNGVTLQMPTTPVVRTLTRRNPQCRTGARARRGAIL